MLQGVVLESFKEPDYLIVIGELLAHDFERTGDGPLSELAVEVMASFAGLGFKPLHRSHGFFDSLGNDFSA